MSIQKNNTRGFTLLETLVYVGLLSLVIVLSSQFVIGILLVNMQGGSREEVVSSATQAIDAIDREVRGAQAVYTPTSVFSAHPGQLSLVTLQHLPFGEQSAYVDFFLSDDARVCARQENFVKQCFTSQKVEITNLRFIRLVSSGGTEAIQTLITARYRSDRASLQAPYSAQTTTIIRAEEK